MTVFSTNPQSTGQECAETPTLLSRGRLNLFETHAVADLQHWPEDRLADLGAIQFPMRYDARTDRYRARYWREALVEVASALAQARSIVLVGSRTRSAELEALQLLISDWTQCPVDLFLCDDERSPGHVRLTTEGRRSASSTRKGSTLLMILGDVPLPEVLGIEGYDTLICLAEKVAAAMFQVRRAAVVLPITADGWRLSHIAFHRLIDIEAEQRGSMEYTLPIANATSSGLPLCAIAAEIRTHIVLHRQTRDFLQENEP